MQASTRTGWTPRDEKNVRGYLTNTEDSPGTRRNCGLTLPPNLKSLSSLWTRCAGQEGYTQSKRTSNEMKVLGETSADGSAFWILSTYQIHSSPSSVGFALSVTMYMVPCRHYRQGVLQDTPTHSRTIGGGG